MWIVSWQHVLFYQVETIVDTVQQCLIEIRGLSLDDVPPATKADYKKRKLIAEV